MTVTEHRRAGAARARLLSAALKLFAEHGVGGTSLQMIADELGVTKAAVYHQFHTKEDILLAVVQPALDDLEAVATAAEAKRGRAAQLEATLTGLADMVVRHRRLTPLLHSDPAVSHLSPAHGGLEELTQRIGVLLAGPDPSAQTRIEVAMVGGGLMLAGTDATLAGLDDETLRLHLVTTARRIFRLRPPRGASVG